MKIDNKCINVARVIAAETIANAGSGHTGIALSGATILYALFKDHLSFSSNKNLFLNRDRLVLSAGHVSALFYTLEAILSHRPPTSRCSSLPPCPLARTRSLCLK